MYYVRLSLPWCRQSVGWARRLGALTGPYAREREKERERESNLYFFSAWMYYVRLSLPWCRQSVGWARRLGALTGPYAREREKERERVIFMALALGCTTFVCHSPGADKVSGGLDAWGL